MTQDITTLWHARQSTREVHCFAVRHPLGYELRIETDDHGLERLVWRQEFQNAETLLERARAGHARLADHGWALSPAFDPRDEIRTAGPAVAPSIDEDTAALPFTRRLKPRCPACGSADMYPAATPKLLESTRLWLCATCDGACVQQRWAGVLALAAGVALFAGSLFRQF